MKFRERLARFYQGRNGTDQFSQFLSWAGLIVLLISLFTTSVGNGLLSNLLWGISLAVIVYGLFRSLSKNIYKRQAENNKYLAVAWKVKTWFRSQKQRIKDAKNFKYFKCPSCKTTLRVPRHKGKIQITCRKCGTKFPGKT